MPRVPAKKRNKSDERAAPARGADEEDGRSGERAQRGVAYHTQLPAVQILVDAAVAAAAQPSRAAHVRRPPPHLGLSEQPVVRRILGTLFMDFVTDIRAKVHPGPRSCRSIARR